MENLEPRIVHDSALSEVVICTAAYPQQCYTTTIPFNVAMNENAVDAVMEAFTIDDNRRGGRRMRTR